MDKKMDEKTDVIELVRKASLKNGSDMVNYLLRELSPFLPFKKVKEIVNFVAEQHIHNTIDISTIWQNDMKKTLEEIKEKLK